MNEVINNILTRASCREFTNQTVSDEQLNLIAKCGVNAPCAMNLQDWQFTVLHNHNLMEELAEAIRTVLSRDKGYNFYSPDALIICSASSQSRFGKEDCACAMENMFLAAHSLGLGTCWINQLRDICDRPEIRKVLTKIGLPENHHVWGMCAVGVPKNKPTPKNKDESKILTVK